MVLSVILVKDENPKVNNFIGVVEYVGILIIWNLSLNEADLSNFV